MDEKEKAFQKRLLATFKLEAAEHVQALSSGLIRLESASSGQERTEIVENVFRGVHSLKGAARAVDLGDIEAICHSAETVFAALKKNELELSPALSDILQEAADALDRMLLSLENEAHGGGDSAIPGLLRRLDDAAHQTGAPVAAARSTTSVADPPRESEADADEPPRREPRASAGEEKRILADTVRIATAKLDALLYQTEELLSAKLIAAQRAAELRQAATQLAAHKKAQPKITPVRKALQRALDRTAKEESAARAHGHARRSADRSAPTDAHLRRLLEFTAYQNDFVDAFEQTLGGLAKAAEHDQRALAGRIDALLEDMKKALMLPFSSALEVFPKLVRDLARDQHKEAALVIEGGDIEVDRRILEALRDPLIHLVRNSLDHGIEAPAARGRAGKPARGTIRLTITPQSGGRIEVAVADDGGGINVAELQQAAGRIGLAPPEERPGAAALLPLVFESGVSTSPIITDISGRGVGLAIVRENVERLGGSVTVDSAPGRGTTFRIVLPMTLATYRGVHVRVNDQRFVVPTTHVEQGARLTRNAIKTVKNRETIDWRGQTVALVRLADALELPRTPAAGAATDAVQVIVLAAGGRRIAFEVDEVLAEQEVLIKPLGRQLARVRNIAGATVLGTGKAVPILNVPDLLQSAVNVASTVGARNADTPQAAAERKSILIAEDSITSRALLKNILESAGYRVATAVDGSEAFGLLKTEAFDLVVSDVEMPRLNGFDLTAKIRADQALADTPVVLVTGLESREHRERGIDAGANAYVIKSSFDHSNLLDIVRRLL